jgi:hypothetical protein
MMKTMNRTRVSKILRSPRYHGHSHECRYHAESTGATKVFVQKDTREQDRNRGVERAEHNRNVQAPDLFSPNKCNAATDIENARGHSDAENWCWNWPQESSKKNDHPCYHERTEPGTCGDPQGIGIPRPGSTKIKTSEADTREHGHAQPLGASRISFGA